MTMREVDLTNVEKLKVMKGITILHLPSEIFEIIEHYLAS